MPSGEYPSNTLRTTYLKIPVVAGYTTGRLRAHTTLPAAGQNIQTNFVTAQISTENDSNTGTVVLQLVAANDISSSGARTNIGSPISLVRGGTTNVNFDVTQNYVEVQCVSGQGQVDLQLSSRVKFDIVGFLRSEAIYPTAIWAASYATPTTPLTTNTTFGG